MRRLWSLLLPLLAFSGQLRAATPEVEVKATYLFKLAAFVRWPDALADGDPFRICVAGRTDIAGALTSLVRDQQVGGSRLAVVQLVAEQDARGCQMLFVGRGAATARSMVKATSGNPVLTITDRSGGTHGGIIEFVTASGKVRLAVDRGAAEARRLQLSSKLMDVAVEVKQ
jgi:hypothetical protein